MGFGRGFGGAPSRTDGGKKTVNTVVEPTIDRSRTSLTISDLKQGVIYLDNSDRDTIEIDLGLPASAQTLIRDLGLSTGETFTFQVVNFGGAPFSLDTRSATTGYVFCGATTATRSGVIKVEFICVDDTGRIIGLFMPLSKI
jgi:hypothetical protein